MHENVSKYLTAAGLLIVHQNAGRMYENVTKLTRMAENARVGATLRPMNQNALKRDQNLLKCPKMYQNATE